MTVQELCDSAKSKKIKLEDLEIEDILKFGQIGFINPMLCEYFDLSLEEVKKIRKRKGLKNSDLEDFVRNMIVLYNYIKTTYPNFSGYKFKEFVMTLATGSIKFSGHREFYKREVGRIDWINMDPKKEIELRKIDVKNREEYFLNKLYPYIDDLVLLYENNVIHENRDFSEVKDIKVNKKERTSRTVSSISRNSNISENALRKARYLCEIDPNHQTFIKRSNYQRYMEPHHLIPLEFQDYFKYSLDVEANIISLCSNCHNEIHYGVNYKELINKLYVERKEQLNKCGLVVSLEELYKMYEN